jgi:8-oxo-dGTP diphosphatase
VPDLKIILCSAAAIIDADNRILIQCRPTGKPYAGYWEFPGGKLDIGETPEQALVRELQEELGITTFVKALFPVGFVSYSYPEQHMLMPVYGIRNWTGVPQAKIGQELAWVKPARLSDYNLLPSNVMLLPTLRAVI